MSWLNSDVPIYARLLLTGLAGLMLGLPYRHRPSAIRTHIFVTLGAGIFAATALDMARASGEADAIRVIQGIASGVGFVGAASVLKKGNAISGLTEAASIWISAALGCAVVLGQPWRAVLTAFIVMLIGFISQWYLTWLPRRRRRLPPR